MVINSACKQFQVDSEEYELSYAQKKLDPNLLLVFSGPPDGSLLVLRPNNKKTKNEKSVVVNLVVGDETVSSGEFKKTASLWDVSQKLLPEGKFVEDDRLCISCLSKKVVGPDMLKKVILSSLKCEEGPLIISLNRKYSSEKLAVEKKLKDVKTNDNKGSNTNHHQNLAKSNIINVKTVSSRFSKKIVLKDMREIQKKIGKIKVPRYKAEACIDKNFYLTPEKKLKDITYLNSRKGIAYILKKPALEGQKEESAVDLLDLRRDYTKSSDDGIQLKLILPDETAIRAMFRKDETIKDVSEFLSPLLRCKNSDFFLYTTNSREIIEANRPLAELEDCNGVTLYLSLIPKTLKTWSKSRPYLKEEYLPRKDFIP